jgi:hypothetical protein
MANNNTDWWSVDLESMPGFEPAMRRVYAWFENEILDRAPIRFMAHNSFLNQEADFESWTPQEKKARWLDAEYQIDTFVKSIHGKVFHGETFPVYFPNLGPDAYAAFYGSPLEFGEVTSWSVPIVRDWSDIAQLQLDFNNEYFRKVEQLTCCALERCQGKFLVGYTDLHPGLDCVAAWRDPQQFCLDLMDAPEMVHQLAELAVQDFGRIYDHFDAILKSNQQLSVSWMGIPSFGRMHIPSCDVSTLISKDHYIEFGLPLLEREVRGMDHNIFHMDGKGVARHLDAILSVPEVHAIQWVQGVGDDQPIMQWLPFIKQLQARKVPTIVDLHKSELEGFLDAMEPEGLYLWVAAENEQEELGILKRLEKWT